MKQIKITTLVKSRNETKAGNDKQLKPKFHYANFATFTKTSPQREVVDTNHKTPQHKSCRQLS